MPRSSHAKWSPPPGRPDPVTILEEQARSRVPDLVPVRHGPAGSSDRFDRAIEEFAVAYAEQNELDYQRLLNAIEARLPAVEGL